jgi:hypothetical protein
MLLTLSGNGEAEPATLAHVLASLDTALPIEEVDYTWDYQAPWSKVDLSAQEPVQGMETWMRHMLLLLKFELDLRPGSNELVLRYPLAAGNDDTNTVLPSYDYFMYFEPSLWGGDGDMTITINLPNGYSLTEYPHGFSRSGRTYTAQYTDSPKEDLAFTLHRTFPASVLNRRMFQLYAVPHFLIGFFLVPVLIIAVWASFRSIRRLFGLNG